MRRKTVSSVQPLSVSIVSFTSRIVPLVSSFFPDLPGASDLIIEEGSDLTKGNTALLSCLLEDFGKPEVTQYRWTKSVSP